MLNQLKIGVNQKGKKPHTTRLKYFYMIFIRNYSFQHVGDTTSVDSNHIFVKKDNPNNALVFSSAEMLFLLGNEDWFCDETFTSMLFFCVLMD